MFYREYKDKVKRFYREGARDAKEILITVRMPKAPGNCRLKSCAVVASRPSTVILSKAKNLL